MITLRKLTSLQGGTRIRKAVRLLESALAMLRQGNVIDYEYYRQICLLVSKADDRVSADTRNRCLSLIALLDPTTARDTLIWALSDIIFLLYTDLHIERADWDFFDDSGENLDGSQRRILPFTIVLDRLRSPFNVGSIFRTADSFGVQQMILVSPTASPEHRRAQRSARGCTSTIPWEHRSEEEVRLSLSGKPVFAMELGGSDIATFDFPHEGVMIVGSEELGTSGELLAIADSSLGRVSIPTAGSKGSLNVSVAFGIVMQAWFSRISS